MTAYNIVHRIRGIRQGRATDCWAAATAMAMGGNATVASVKQLASAAGVRLNPNGTLVSNDLPNTQRLARAAGLRCRDLRRSPLTMQSTATSLSRGRMVILGGFNYPNRNALNHAVTMYRLVGDTDHPAQARISLIDPFDGLPYHDNWQHFNEDADGVLADPHFFLTH